MPRVSHPSAATVRELVHLALLRGPQTVLELHELLADVVPRHDRYMIQAALRALEKHQVAQGLSVPSADRAKLWWLTELGYSTSSERETAA